MGQSFHAVSDANEQTEIGDLRHGPHDLVADVVGFGEVVPLVRQKLFDGKGEPLIVAIDADDPRLDAVTLLQHLVGMLEPPIPRHIGDVNQAVDPFLQLYECSEVSEVADFAGDDRADRIAFRRGDPRVLLQCLQGEGDSAVGHIHVGNHRLDLGTR